MMKWLLVPIAATRILCVSAGAGTFTMPAPAPGGSHPMFAHPVPAAVESALTDPRFMSTLPPFAQNLAKDALGPIAYFLNENGYRAPRHGQLLEQIDTDMFAHAAREAKAAIVSEMSAAAAKAQALVADPNAPLDALNQSKDELRMMSAFGPYLDSGDELEFLAAKQAVSTKIAASVNSHATGIAQNLTSGSHGAASSPLPPSPAFPAPSPASQPKGKSAKAAADLMALTPGSQRRFDAAKELGRLALRRDATNPGSKNLALKTLFKELSSAPTSGDRKLDRDYAYWIAGILRDIAKDNRSQGDTKANVVKALLDAPLLMPVHAANMAADIAEATGEASFMRETMRLLAKKQGAAADADKPAYEAAGIRLVNAVTAIQGASAVPPPPVAAAAAPSPVAAPATAAPAAARGVRQPSGPAKAWRWLARYKWPLFIFAFIVLGAGVHFGWCSR